MPHRLHGMPIGNIRIAGLETKPEVVKFSDSFRWRLPKRIEELCEPDHIGFRQCILKGCGLETHLITLRAAAPSPARVPRVRGKPHSARNHPRFHSPPQRAPSAQPRSEDREAPPRPDRAPD